MVKRYLIDGNNEKFALTLGFQSDINLLLNGLGVDDVTGHTFAFDIGQEGEDALFSATATIIDPIDPVEISLSIPAGTFTQTHSRLVLQIRWTDLAPVERIIFKGFIDVLQPVTPKP